MVEVRLLGGVRAAAGDDALLDLGPPKCRLVLAALALNHGEAVPVPRLVDLVWGEEPPGTASKILQGYVSRLRKALGADALARVDAAYRLERVVEVDATRFVSLVGHGDVDGALALLAGAPLAGLDPIGLQPAVDGLVERWLEANEQQLTHRAEDDPAGVVGPLVELTQAHPFREGLWVALVLALARSGRQADALTAYRRARDRLVGELGIDPGERLRAAETRVLAGDVRPVVESRPPPAIAARDGLDRLPAVPDLLGRNEDVAVVLRALRTASLVTLLGPGGIGKTTLAVFLGYTLQLRGNVDDARERFLAAAEVAIPPGTYAATRPAEVEALFAAGDHDRARSLLLEHIDDVLAMGTVDVARLVAVAFVNVMVGMDRLEDAAPALAYLDSLGDFGQLARTILVAEAAARIGDLKPFEGDAAAALHHMRGCLAP